MNSSLNTFVRFFRFNGVGKSLYAVNNSLCLVGSRGSNPFPLFEVYYVWVLEDLNVFGDSELSIGVVFCLLGALFLFRIGILKVSRSGFCFVVMATRFLLFMKVVLLEFWWVNIM